MASLIEKIESDLKTAMKSRDQETLDTLRLLKSDLQYEMTKAGNREMDDAAVEVVLKKAVKKRQESIVDLEKAGRSSEVESETRAIERLKTYLPQELSEQEIGAEIDAVIAANPDEKNFGKLMGQVMGRLKGKNADGSIVRSLLQNKLGS
ncbi:MAG: GatB/YqeY domain-containing protein [Leptospiraceae bacterium]|nr:GatB/YqeY domain-containing protein [Leptospiraceae bacterium]MCB1306312.1 GatB/YqeY domain-containing protein [Leptospiraceae bacterium]